MIRARTTAVLLCAWLAAHAERAIAQPTPTATATPARFDACALLPKKEVEAIQGSPIKDTKSSERVDGDFRMSQCFFTAAEFSRSVTLAVFQKHPTDPAKRSPVDFWKHTFGRYENEKAKKEETKPQERGEREEGEGVPPRKLEGLGDEAFWVPNRFGGTLYALKGEAFISISIGGSDSEQVKIDKSTKLAAKALRGLKATQTKR
jgi:hypothetical protein